VCATDTHCTIEAVWRIEFARVIAGLIRDLDLAEEKIPGRLSNSGTAVRLCREGRQPAGPKIEPG
jgi:hypothetical protein